MPLWKAVFSKFDRSSLLAALLIGTSSLISVAEEPASPTERVIPLTQATSADVEPRSFPSDDRLASQPLELTSHSEAVAAGQPCGKPDCPTCNPPAAKPPAPPPVPWKVNFFDNDFSYKKKPSGPHFFGEELKDMPLDFVDGLDFLDGSTLSVGGEIRHRYVDENNRLRPNFFAPPNTVFRDSGRSNYNQWRWRQYMDLKVRDEVRVYVEMLDASEFGENLPITGIDVNRWNIQNAFVDLKVAERDDKPVYFRAGRQELLFGAPSALSPGQQVVSPLDWANTRRNFEGFRLTSKGTEWDFDLFATRPVNTANPTGPKGGRPAFAGLPNSVTTFDNQRDSADYSRWFSGLYSVYRGIQNQTIEPYYVWLQTDKANQDPTWADGNRHTVGMRWTTTKPFNDELDKPWFVFGSDLEGAYQFGNDNNEKVRAGFFTSKVGGTLAQAAWTPNLQLIYYWGSGDRKAGDGKNNTYSILFPLNHAYWGIIDNLSGQNLNDIAIQGSVKPHAKLTCLSALHWFSLDSNADALYTVTGGPLTKASGLGKNVGQELDLIATYNYNPNFDVQAGYSWFWYGDNITNRKTVAQGGLADGSPRGDASQFYIQTSIRY